MKLITVIFSILFLTPFLSPSQNFAVGVDRNNILYVGVDNPLSIAVTSVPNKSIIAKASLGKVSYQYNTYVFNSEVPGATEITLYQKVKGNLKKIGSNYFRIKLIPDPVFKIASGKDSIRLVEFQNQQYVRAELENFDFDTRFTIKKFTAIIISKDTCKYKEIENETNEIGESLHSEFTKLNVSDIVIFKNILVSGPGGERVIHPRMFFIL